MVEHTKATKDAGSDASITIQTQGEMDGDLSYERATIKQMENPFLLRLRLAMVGVESKSTVDTYLAYATHASGVILRAYDAAKIAKDDICVIDVIAKSQGIMEIATGGKTQSILAVMQESESLPSKESDAYLFEASYIHPDVLVEAFSQTKLKSDDLYYKTSRGSASDLDFGLSLLRTLMAEHSDVEAGAGRTAFSIDRPNHTIMVEASEVSAIMGMEIGIDKIATILEKLGFGIDALTADSLNAIVPLFRHDMRHIQDITEEIVRIVGINNIPAKPLAFTEQARLNSTTDRYKARKGFKNRAVGLGYYENVSYVFSDEKLLTKYGFAVTDEELALVNPIAEELNTLRSTLLINLLLAAKRNVSYSKKSIPLFEIGERFTAKREQSEVISFLFSGQLENDSIKNAGKPAMIDFAHFTQKLGGVIGAFELEPCSYENGLLHPYQSANVLVDGTVCGFVSKLHPEVQGDFDLPVTFIAEIDFDALLPKHINAKAISKFQGVYKDLSVVIAKSLSYYEVAKVLNGLNIEMLQDSYPVDIYQDEALGDQKSLTIRFFIQSMEKTLEEADIEAVMSKVMDALSKDCNASLR